MLVKGSVQQYQRHTYEEKSSLCFVHSVEDVLSR